MVSKCFFCVFLLGWSLCAQHAYALVPAFPGAEGFGAQATGGRGGQIIEVTNLNDSGPGSLRKALLTTAPRIVVFRVGGEIVFDSPIRLRAEHSHLTLAGQSAPGGGITLRNRYAPGSGKEAPITLDKEVENVIIRYIRFRPGPSYESSSAVRGLTIWGRNIIIDHCSFSWSTDEVINVWYNAKDITIQWSIISEGLDMSNHPDTIANGTGHSVGVLFGGSSTNISFHHNLIAHVGARGPRAKNGRIDVVNNVNYNSGSTPSRLDNQENETLAEYNAVGNFMKRGPDSTWNVEFKLRDYSGASDPLLAVYLEGNIGMNRTDDSQPQDLVVDTESKSFVVTTPHVFPSITTTTAFVAYDQVLADAGVTIPQRDAVDARIVQEVSNHTGKIIDHPNEVGGWPPISDGTAPDDRDHDGMPDTWEEANGFNPDEAGDGIQDADGDGYTNVEEFLNGTTPSNNFRAPTNLRIVLGE